MVNVISLGKLDIGVAQFFCEMKAMILAAGFGTRLFPLTIDRTKPAIPFLGKPLVGYVAEYLVRYGFDDVVINLHHQPDSVRRALGDGNDYGVKIEYTLEIPKILGTAGALDNAREHLENDTFLVANGKIITDIDIQAALHAHKKSGAIATMILKPNEKFEEFTEVYTRDGRVTGFGKGFPDPKADRSELPAVPFMFTGIHILDPRVFEYIPRGVYSDIVPSFYDPAIANGELINAYVTAGRWFELSTIQRYLEISLEMLDDQSGRVSLGNNCNIDSSAIIENSVVWDNVTIGKGARVINSVIGDNVKVGEGESFENVAVVRGDMLNHCDEIPKKALKGGMIGENYVVPLNQ